MPLSRGASRDAPRRRPSPPVAVRHLPALELLERVGVEMAGWGERMVGLGVEGLAPGREERDDDQAARPSGRRPAPTPTARVRLLASRLIACSARTRGGFGGRFPWLAKSNAIVARVKLLLGCDIATVEGCLLPGIGNGRPRLPRQRAERGYWVRLARSLSNLRTPWTGKPSGIGFSVALVRAVGRFDR